MKTKITFFAFFFLSLSLQAQLFKEGTSIGITFSGLGENATYYWADLIGKGSYHGRGYPLFRGNLYPTRIE